MANIIFQKSGVTAPWTGDEESILELAEANDLDLEFGCRMGNCTACQQKVVSGEVEYPNGHTGEPDEGNELMCCCQPKGDADVVVDA
jgi:ferredoxin